jgi:hypothetical protein
MLIQISLIESIYRMNKEWVAVTMGGRYEATAV